MTVLPRGREVVPDRLDQERGPGTEAGQYYGDEEPERLVMMVDLGEVTLEMFPDEIEVKELGIGPSHQDVPGGGDGEEDDRAGQEMHGPEPTPFAGDEHPGEDDHAREHDADKPLGQNRESREAIETPEEEHSRASGRFAGSAQERQ